MTQNCDNVIAEYVPLMFDVAMGLTDDLGRAEELVREASARMLANGPLGSADTSPKQQVLTTLRKTYLSQHSDHPFETGTPD